MARRPVLLLLLPLIAMGLVVSDLGTGLDGPAVSLAQAKKPGLFERLFGPKKPPPQRSNPPRSPSPIKRILPVRKKSPPSRSAPSRSTAVAVVEEQPKDENARKILIVGDFVGAALAWGLEQALAEEPMLVVVERINGPSGLVRSDRYDWNKELLGILNEETPDIVVVALGANDRQEITEGDVRHPLRSQPWQDIYTQRIDSLADTLRVYGRPFFWMSAPPLRGEQATSDMAYLNGLFEPRVVKAGGHFVDVWNGFVNASGQYITTGPDIEGQVKALRTSDGVNFTSVGKQKLAYYVERDIRRFTGIGTGAVDLIASASQQSTIEIGPDGKKRLVGPVISLTDPLPGTAPALAGAPDPIYFDPVSGTTRPVPKPPMPDVQPEEETLRYRLIVKGESLPVVAGRVDDFAWPPSQRASQTFLAPAASVDPATAGEEGDEQPAAALTDISASE
jgi:hypothetical protein